MYKTFACLIALLSISLVGARLYCFRCLAMDCPGDDEDCQRIRDFIAAEMRSYYYIDSYIDVCPALNETTNWRIMQIASQGNPCPEEKPNEATCTLGRMQIRTIETDPEGKTTVRLNHATIMGCANRQLLTAIKTAFNQGKCDIAKQNRTSVGIVRELLTEHCRDLVTQCHEKDYCIDYKQSIVKPWGGDPSKDKHFEVSLIIGILGVVVVIICALLIAGLLRDPPNIPSSFPKSIIGDDSESVKVLDIRDNDYSSVEVPPERVNTLGRRPSAPPPPPPRQKHQRNGGTSV